MITGKNYIGFTLQAEGNQTFKTIDPLENAQNEWEFTEASDAEINEAVAHANAAFTKFRKLPAERRSEFLEAIADEIEALGDDLLETFHKESGLEVSRARVERGRTTYQLRMYADFLRSNNWMGEVREEAEPDRSPKPKPSLYKTYLPLGPIAVFGASNFPLAYSTAGGDTASAFAAGCPVIVKSHPMHAGTGELVATAIVTAAKKTEMPFGVFSNLNSKDHKVGVKLVENPGIKGVGFTGSIRGGRALFDLAAKRDEPIPVFAEMGSINPVIISNAALKANGAKWVKHYADSITNGTGQFCTNPGLILGLKSKTLDKFIDELASELDNRASTVMLNPSISTSFHKLRSDVLKQNEVKQESSKKSADENHAIQTVASVSGTEFLVNPTLHQEVFGPFSLVVKCQNMNQMLQIVKTIEGQLTGTVILEDEELNDFEELIDQLSMRVGRLVFNGVPTGVEVVEAMHHGGPYPATTDSRFTAVGIDGIKRWLRPICYQNAPEQLFG